MGWSPKSCWSSIPNPKSYRIPSLKPIKAISKKSWSHSVSVLSNPTIPIFTPKNKVSHKTSPLITPTKSNPIATSSSNFSHGTSFPAVEVHRWELGSGGIHHMDVPGIGESHGISWWSCCFMLAKSPFFAGSTHDLLVDLLGNVVADCLQKCSGFQKRQWGMAPNQWLMKRTISVMFWCWWQLWSPISGPSHFFSEFRSKNVSLKNPWSLFLCWSIPHDPYVSIDPKYPSPETWAESEKHHKWKLRSAGLGLIFIICLQAFESRAFMDMLDGSKNEIYDPRNAKNIFAAQQNPSDLELMAIESCLISLASDWSTGRTFRPRDLLILAMLGLITISGVRQKWEVFPSFAANPSDE